MTDTSELSALVVRNIGDIEAAMTQAHAIDDQLFEECEKAILEILPEADWHAHTDVEERYLWIARRDWLDSQSKVVRSDYWIELVEQEGSGGDDNSWLAEFLRSGPSGATIAFTLYGHTFKPKRWKALLQTSEDIIGRLLEAGFQQDEDQRLSLPLILDRDALATGFENDDLTAAMKPVRDALAIILAAQDDLDTLVARDRAAA